MQTALPLGCAVFLCRNEINTFFLSELIAIQICLQEEFEAEYALHNI
jgi:hypothetical protein